MDSMADSNKLDIWNKSFSNPYVYNGRSQTMGELRWCRIEVLQLTQLEDSAILEPRSPLWRPLRDPFSNTFWDYNLWLIMVSIAFRQINMTCLYKISQLSRQIWQLSNKNPCNVIIVVWKLCIMSCSYLLASKQWECCVWRWVLPPKPEQRAVEVTEKKCSPLTFRECGQGS